MSIFAVIYTYIVVTAVGAGVFALLGTREARTGRPATPQTPAAALRKAA